MKFFFTKQQGRIIIILSLIFGFASCSSTKIIPIKDSYPEPPIQFNSTKSFDEIWDNLIDEFAQKGLAIKIIDRSSGLIISERSKMASTCEKPEGGLVNPDAFIVVPRYYNRTIRKYVPITRPIVGAYASKSTYDKSYPVFGEWNVRIKKNGTGTLININITNLYYEDLEDKIVKKKEFVYKTTGVFENMLANRIK